MTRRIIRKAQARMVGVAGSPVTPYEFAILEELSHGDDTARSLGVNVAGGGGWKALRALTNLEALGLVQRYEVDNANVYGWRLTAHARKQFEAVA